MKDKLAGQINLQSLFDANAAPALLGLQELRGASTAKNELAVCCLIGSPQFNDSDASTAAKVSGVAAGLLVAWQKYGIDVVGRMGGSFAFAIMDADKAQVFLAVDRFATETVCFYLNAETLEFSDRADCIGARSGVLDPQAVFDYLFFHMIPSPRTIFGDVRRLPAGHSLTIDRNGSKMTRHWPRHVEAIVRTDFSQARDTLHRLISDSVKREIEGEQQVGAFLSGGTDSSTVAGVLCKVTGASAATYSIGFEADGYDEMEYARLAARHFGCQHHEYYVTPGDVLSGIPGVAQTFDQPFGNSSALPAYFCAKMAKEDGCTKILAGDGGDELFGGNTRYATQRFLNYYHALPTGLRGLIEPLCGDDSLLRKIPGLRQATGYVRHSKLPLPHRMQSMNLTMQLDPRKVLTPGFLDRVNISDPARQMQETWDAAGPGSIVNRLLAYDWRYTLAESDLRKVNGATALAGIAVGYPLLSDALVDFSMTLPPHWKLRGFKLRWFFKEAMRGFLPDQIIVKKKQGFGLPFGPWTANDPKLREMARGSVQGLVDRGIVQQQFVNELIGTRLGEHPGYYGEMVWILMMLEQWLRGQPDAHLPP